MTKTKKLIVDELEISLTKVKDEDYICLTDMIKAKDGDFFISDWLRNINTLDYLAAWENLNNPDFNYGEFAIIRSESGGNSYKISVKEWVSRTNAIGITAKTGRYGGTYANVDIAFNFGMWISPEFQLYIVTEYKRLKEIESNQLNLEWDVRRLMTKINYGLHTDAVQKHIIPNSKMSQKNQWIEYANEADLLNVALYGYTAKEWKQSNPELSLKGKNMRDFSSITDLLIMSNLESLNAELIKNKLSKEQRFHYLKKLALEQRDQFNKVDMIKSIKRKDETTYVEIGNLTPEEIEEESKKDILEANKRNLSNFNQKLKKGLNYNPKEEDN
ncbi:MULTISPECIES: KilA-N domain-containing protein [unclassified Leeuwenhoekiella]|uniref:KilA-N domain-containing protein n=1 Tax=unclassified Leeuwenhoekiella TaxID=2615029 RepID=UPI000C51F6A7|nr:MULTISPECIES: KilA-N domain-containing protein [unclassified Leeuwenhoekiella]MAW96172.1 DNA-binding protein [Leeuwenhoekiella sp.]MBA80166.1 DNA-binding protein [Leeuwenhoekiella sp.]|tara:strand:- start:5259 stop:6248 length:990 start_codon:yes stop_codon:yes gene_type:complete